MSTTTQNERSVSARARIIQIERDHADVDFSTVNHYWKHEGLTYQDAMHAEELEREVDRLEATAAAVGLSDEERARLNSVSAELDRFVSAAKCHAEKQEARKVERIRAVCPHDNTTVEIQQTDAGRSPAHPAPAAPPEGRQVLVCTDCGKEFTSRRQMRLDREHERNGRPGPSPYHGAAAVMQPLS